MGQWVKAMTVHTWEPEFKPQIPQCEEKTSSQNWSTDIHTCTHSHNIEANISSCMCPWEWMIVCAQGCVYLRLAFSFITSPPLSLSVWSLHFLSSSFSFIDIEYSVAQNCLFVLFESEPHETQIHYATEAGPQFLTSSLYLPRAETAGVLLKEVLETRSHVARAHLDLAKQWRLALNPDPLPLKHWNYTTWHDVQVIIPCVNLVISVLRKHKEGASSGVDRLEESDALPVSEIYRFSFWSPWALFLMSPQLLSVKYMQLKHTSESRVGLANL